MIAEHNRTSTASEHIPQFESRLGSDSRELFCLAVFFCGELFSAAPSGSSSALLFWNSERRLQVNLQERTCKNPPLLPQINVTEHKVSPCVTNAAVTCLVLFQILLQFQETRRQKAPQCKIWKAAWIHQVRTGDRKALWKTSQLAVRSTQYLSRRRDIKLAHREMNRRLLPVFKIHTDTIRIPRIFAHGSGSHF